MHDADVRLLEESFKKYYFDHPGMIRVPERPMLREFGYQRFNSGMIRHLRARDDRELRLMIIQNVPSDVYCSNGYYSFPNLPMAEKDWQEADLIFDIDAKDLNLPCRTDHAFKKCSSCGKAFQASPACPGCESPRHESKSLPCTKCTEAAKKEVRKLSEILTEDLGVDAASIRVYFSGNEGFHVHVYGTQLRRLGSRERAEIADYVAFRGAIPDAFGMKKRHAPDRSAFPLPEEGGWRGRLARQILGPKSGHSKAVTRIMGGGYRSFADQLAQASPIIGANIDPNVTTDIHRIFRLPGSLNGKSGLTKAPCEDLDGFNPYTDACLINGDPVRVAASSPTGFALNGETFGPYDGEPVTVPRFAAVYMICKGLASAA